MRPGATDSVVSFAGSQFQISAPGRPRLRLAVRANAPDAQAVARRSEIMLRGDLVLPVFDLLAVELYQPAAFGADQMVVMLVVVKVFVTRVGVAQTFLSRQPAFGQEFERAVNSRESHGRILDFDYVVEVFRAEMTFGLEKDFEYQLTLRRLFESGAPEMFKKNLSFLGEFGHYDSRDNRHSVDPNFSS